MLGSQRHIRMKLHQLIDAALFALGFFLAHLVRFQLPTALNLEMYPIESFSAYLWLYMIIVPFSPMLLEAQGFYGHAWSGVNRRVVWQALKVCAMAVIGVILVLFILRVHYVARSVIILFGGISFLLLMGRVWLMRRWGSSELGRQQSRRRFVLVGAKEDAERVMADLKGRREGEVEILARLDLNEAPVERLVDLLHEHSANGVILSARHTYFGQIEKAIQTCELEGVEAWLLADFFKTSISRTSMDDFCGRPTLVFQSTPEDSWQGVAKHVMDFLGAVILLALGAILMLLTALLIGLTSKGPILFRQKRSGLNGEPFVMLKFRTMVSDAEQRRHELAAFNEMDGPVFKVTDDPRVTRLGRILRKYSIDELPQLWNVLRGEMSLVGPRPLPVDETRRFNDVAHRRRLSVKPGLTCLWQISGRNEVKDFKDWVRLDLEYIDNWSLWLDLKILLRTVPVVVLGTGAK
jgi:exopolysaccharide biosynthesis polyprenyl glycosylphosphotransferase